jgi:hypothetical protein
VFISYARSDDERPPFDDTTQGWVTFFWHQLRFELINRGVHQAGLWLDRYQIEPAEEFTEKIKAVIAQARLFILILSNNWVQREWSQRELMAFIEQRSDNKDYIVLVKKAEPHQIPDLLKGREGYKFYDEDLTGRVRDFYWRGLKDKSEYFRVLTDVADWIAARLIAGPKRPRTMPAPKNRTIFVAVPSDELRDAWQRVANDLNGAGFTVVPSEGTLPDTAANAEKAIRAALEEAEMSVHLLGESEGAKPDGSDETFVRMQLRLDRETAASRRRVLWAPKWLPDRGNEKRDPFDVVERFGGLQPGEQVFAEEITDLSQWLRQQLDPTRADPAIAPVLVVVAAAAESDDHLVSALANRLQSDGITVRPMFTGEAVPPVPEAGRTAVLVLWGEATREAIDLFLARVSIVGARMCVLCLAGGDQTAKNRFFKDGVYAEHVQLLPPNPKAAHELLVQLEIIGTDERRRA